ncbi:hypothetical protein T440DRAFT_520467 [Plenodomus tracheiphilus IPT5]|uniref:Uncharacterized protein n=1 Tax=Plenodomus tracheiphilus IPT5 TaxID=1408161 RepID=A0A6A7AXP9_9PLEO|nr:hypothetical protein T440DRAFT_520467 [Plenodomus tracheiphilus IPT5]
MSTGSTKALAEQGVAPLNFIYACSECCASFADVYEGHNESVQGLSDGINPKERLVTKLYLATCCHVFCSRHLEGGGPPFHPAGQRPKAPCPVCTREKGDREVRELYSIRGFNNDEYDPQIPPSWFNAPPIRLDGNGKEMEALRFQYIALIRYCQNTHAARKPIQNALTAAEHNIARLEGLASVEHAKVLSLEQEKQQQLTKNARLEEEVQRLRGLGAEVERYRNLDVSPHDLETFRANKTAIRHYLKLVPFLLEQNEKMRAWLASLGLAMALQPVPNFREMNSDALDSQKLFPETHTGDIGALAERTASSQTAGRSTHTAGREATAPLSPFDQRPLKRQRQDSPHSDKMGIISPTSRDAMPPPPKPISKMQSMRKIIPIVRKKFSQTRSTSPMENVSQSTGTIQMMEHEHWQNASHYRQELRDNFRDGTPYMSGALPIDEHREAVEPHESQLPSRMGIQDRRSVFVLRATSPVEAHTRMNGNQAVQTPTEPSYTYLLDGLSQNEEVKLELKDPRQVNAGVHRDVQLTSEILDIQSEGRPAEVQKKKKKKFWDLAHPFLDQTPQKALSMPQSQMNRHRTGPTEPFDRREYFQTPECPITPAPKRYQHTNHQAESVVSPFFKSSHRQAPLQSTSGLAEPQASSHLSGAFHSQKARMTVGRTDWHEPPSLNGLSFFDSPVNAKNEVIQQPYRHDVAVVYPSSPHVQSCSIDSRGFITRPDVARSPSMDDSAYGSSRRRFNDSRYTKFPTQSAVPLLSFRPSCDRRTTQQYPARPHMAIGRSPVRTRPQWEPLQRAGVRSSRQSFKNIVRGSYAGSTMNLISKRGRRSINR